MPKTTKTGSGAKDYKKKIDLEFDDAEFIKVMNHLVKTAQTAGKKMVGKLVDFDELNKLAKAVEKSYATAMTKFMDQLEFVKKEFADAADFRSWVYDLAQVDSEMQELPATIKRMATEMVNVEDLVKLTGEGIYDLKDAYGQVASLAARENAFWKKRADFGKKAGTMSKADVERTKKLLSSEGRRVKEMRIATEATVKRVRATAKENAILAGQSDLMKRLKGHWKDVSGASQGYKTMRGAGLTRSQAAATTLTKSATAASGIVSGINSVVGSLSPELGAVLGLLDDGLGLLLNWQVALIALPIVAFLKIDSSLTKMNKLLAESVSQTGLLNYGWQAMEQQVAQMQVFDTVKRSMREFNMDMEEVFKVSEGLAAQGLSIKQIYKRDALGISNLERVIALTKITGIESSKLYDMIGDYTIDLRERFEDVEENIIDMGKAAEKSGLGVQKFLNILNSSTNQMSVFNKNIKQAAELTKALGKAGAVTTGELQETLQNVTTYWDKASFEERFMHEAMGGGAARMEYMTTQREDLMKRLQQELAKTGTTIDLTGAKPGASIQDAIGESFDILDDTTKQLIVKIDALGRGIQSGTTINMQGYSDVGMNLAGIAGLLNNIDKRGPITLERLQQGLIGPEVLRQMVEATGVSSMDIVNLLKEVQLGVKTDTGETIHNLQDLAKWLATVDDTSSDAAKAQKEKFAKLLGMGQTAADKQASYWDQLKTYLGSFEHLLRKIAKEPEPEMTPETAMARGTALDIFKKVATELPADVIKNMTYEEMSKYKAVQSLFREGQEVTKELAKNQADLKEAQRIPVTSEAVGDEKQALLYMLGEKEKALNEQRLDIQTRQVSLVNALKKPGGVLGKWIGTEEPVSKPTVVPKGELKTNYKKVEDVSQIKFSQDLTTAIAKASQEYKIPPEVLKAIATEESSGGRGKLVNETGKDLERGGAYGPFQMTWETAKDLGYKGTRDQLTRDFELNARLATELFLRNLKIVGGDLEKAFALYNGTGPAARAYGRKRMNEFAGFYAQTHPGEETPENIRDINITILNSDGTQMLYSIPYADAQSTDRTPVGSK